MTDPMVELKNEITALRARVAELEAEQAQGSSYHSRAFQHLVSDSEHIFVTVIDTQGHYAYVNPAFVAKFCAAQEPPLGRNALETVVPEDWSKLEQATIQCFTQPGHPVRVTVRKPSTSGIVYTTDWELIGIANLDGVPEGVLCIGVDITEHLKTQQDLETVKLRFDQLANNIHDVFWLYDRTLQRVVYVSPAFATVWGYTAEQLYARQELFVDAIYPEDRGLAFSSLLEQAEGKQTEREYRIVNPDGTIHYIWDRGFPIKNMRGEVVSVAGIASDITELKVATERIRQLNETLEQRVQKRTEELTQALEQRQKAEEYLRATSEALAQANAELGAAARMKDEFLANVSHELRTPLTGILAISEALQAGTYGSLADAMQRPVRLIEESGRHLLSLINDVLDVAKIEAGSFQLELGQVQIDEICMASLRLVREIAVQRRQTVSFSMDPAGIVLEADARRLKQLLVNLLGNAVKFTPEGGQLGLHVRGDAMQKAVTFSVWDNGIGIPADKLPQLFQPFMQVQSEFNRAYGGTGLGLALVQRLAALHKGTVAVYSEPGKGSRFDVTLPWKAGVGAGVQGSSVTGGMETAPDVQAEPLAAGPDAGVKAEPPKQITILLAEDNDVTRSVLADFLELEGYAVLQAGDGAQAVKLAAESRPNLVMMDIQMPGMDGVEAIRIIRSLDDPAVASVPIVALTAHAMHGAREHFMEAGADGYLSKPLRLADLRRSITEYLPQPSAQG